MEEISTKAGWLCAGSLAVALGGCGIFSGSPPSSLPFFAASTADSTKLEAVSRELTTAASQCGEPPACEEVQYARALTALYQSRAAAQASFRRVIKMYPTGSYNASSTLWLQLLEKESPQSTAAKDVMSHLVRDWIDRKVNGLRTQKTTLVSEQDLVQSLQKQIGERDRRIAELTSQLDILKLIDQEMEEKKKINRLPATLSPSGSDPR
ncbi:MAG TPA: hypothetical protein VH681_13785 [Nitrospiraceae bacterium]